MQEISNVKPSTKLPTKYIFPANLSGYNRCVKALKDEFNILNIKINKPLSEVPFDDLSNHFSSIGETLITLKLLGVHIGEIINIVEKTRLVNELEKESIKIIVAKTLMMFSINTFSNYSRSINAINEEFRRLHQSAQTLEDYA